MPRRLVAVLALPALAAACGGSKSPTTTTTSANAAPTVEAAVEKTVKAGSEHVALTASATASGQNVTIAGSGDFDSQKRLGKLTATIGLGGVQSQIDEVVSGTTIYVGSQLFASLLPAGKQWLKIDLTAAGKALGVDTSVLGAQDPAAALAQLEALKGLKEVGAATIGGVQTTRYRGSIDVSKLPAGSAGVLGQSGTTFGPTDVWVGADGYVHRMRVTTKANSGTGNVSKTVLTMTLSKFGESVLVSTPPASSTVDASKLSIPGLTG